MTRAQQFLLGCGLVLLGIALGNELPRAIVLGWPWFVLAAWWFAVGLSFVALAAWWPDYWVRKAAIGFVLVIMSVGWSLGVRIANDPGDLPEGRQTISGTIVTFPEVKGRKQRFELQGSIDGRRTRILVEASREPRLARGEKITVQGTLRRPRESADFSETRWLEGRGVFGVMGYPEELIRQEPPNWFWRGITQVREKIATALNRALPEPAASLAVGLAIGVDPEIDQDFAEHLRRTNLTHLAAVSGQNLVLTIFVIFGILRRRWLKAAVLISLTLTALYTILTGAEASIVRAAIMASFVLGATILGRPVDARRSLLFVAVTLALIHPMSLTRDVGFHLSFLALAGILVLSPIFVRRMPSWLPGELELATILGATLAVMPYQAVVFEKISLSGPLANMLVAPIVSYAMGGALALGIVIALVPQAASIATWVLYPALEYIHQIALFFSRFRLAEIPFSPGAWSLLLVIGEIALFFVVQFMARNPRQMNIYEKR